MNRCFTSSSKKWGRGKVLKGKVKEFGRELTSRSKRWKIFFSLFLSFSFSPPCISISSSISSSFFCVWLLGGKKKEEGSEMEGMKNTSCRVWNLDQRGVQIKKRGWKKKKEEEKERERWAGRKINVLDLGKLHKSCPTRIARGNFSGWVVPNAREQVLKRVRKKPQN